MDRSMDGDERVDGVIDGMDVRTALISRTGSMDGLYGCNGMGWDGMGWGRAE